MSIVKCHESHYVGVLDNPPIYCHLGVKATTMAMLVATQSYWFNEENNHATCAACISERFCAIHEVCKKITTTEFNILFTI